MPPKKSKVKGDVDADSNKDAAAAGSKRRRAAPVSTASTLQAKALFASTRDELRDIQGELQALAAERRALLAEAATSATGSGVRSGLLHLQPRADRKA